MKLVSKSSVYSVYRVLSNKQLIIRVAVSFNSRRLRRLKNRVMLVNSIAHFIWQTLLASLMFGASQLPYSCSLLLDCLLVLYEVIEQETILLTSYKLQLRALRVLLAVSTLSASRTFIQLSVKTSDSPPPPIMGL